MMMTVIGDNITRSKAAAESDTEISWKIKDYLRTAFYCNCIPGSQREDEVKSK